ncbi:TonB-dependent siderophore receptor [Acidisoma cellulosilytica]|uniref:TonB-dependent siderophore receptor n=1 Tax=Acidisoma cellulosilyticum TaxID=2802395 RepID=A0A964E5W5_9PROT|nr:TonB-dependent siderophore receptor [Acidisoma cellulosilyticum]MCB8882872.1 TonB-dependent siderophore receptor [Acidisoma cellulosilyticum]
MPFAHPAARSQPQRRRALVTALMVSACLTPLAVAVAAHAQSTTTDTVLKPLTVQGKAGDGKQSPTGPGIGYVATRSDTATKTDTPIVQTPQAINVVTADQLRQQQPKSISQALRYTPGVSSEIYGDGARGDFLQIRGFNGYDSIYIDGLKSDNGLWTYNIEPYGLERLEVLKGPSSMLYGQNEPGGLVNAISKRPTDTPQHEVEFQYGSHNSKQFGFDMSGPVEGTDGKVEYRIVGMDRQSDTQVNYTENNRQYIAPSITIKPDADTQVTILANYLRVREPGWTDQGFPQAGTQTYNPNGTISSSTFTGEKDFDQFNMDQVAIGYELEHRFNDWLKFSQNLRYNHITGDSQETYGTALESDDKTLDRATFAEHVNINTIKLDNHLEADFTTGPLRHKVLFGIDYSHTSNDFSYGAGTAPSIDIFAPVYTSGATTLSTYESDIQTVNQIGEYLQDEISWLGFRLLAGVRHDNASTDTYAKIGGTSTTQNDSAWTYRAGLLYLFNNGIAPYVSYSTSFLPTSGTDAEGTPYQPITSRQYELGLKYKPPGWNALFTAALFDLTENNVLTPDPASTLFDVQTGQARSQGLELEAKVSPAPGFDLDAAYTYTDAVVTKSNAGNVGDLLPLVPMHAVNLWAHYKLQNSFARGLGLGAGFRYRGSVYGDTAQQYQVDPVALVDLAMDYDLGNISPSMSGLDIQLNASNIANTQYLANCTSSIACYYGAGRAVYATLAYHW